MNWMLNAGNVFIYEFHCQMWMQCGAGAGADKGRGLESQLCPPPFCYQRRRIHCAFIVFVVRVCVGVCVWSINLCITFALPQPRPLLPRLSICMQFWIDWPPLDLHRIVGFARHCSIPFYIRFMISIMISVRFHCVSFNSMTAAMANDLSKCPELLCKIKEESINRKKTHTHFVRNGRAWPVDTLEVTICKYINEIYI